MNKVKLTANILFAGTGMQERGMTNSNCFDLTVVSTSEIDKNAILSYAAVHYGLTPEELDNRYKHDTIPHRQYMLDTLYKLNIGYDFVNNKVYNWERCTDQELFKYYHACMLNHNVGDISKVERLPYADLWTYSYPCTDISAAGKQLGMVQGETRSGLLYEVLRLLKQSISDNTQPKYLLMENVDALLSNKFYAGFLQVILYLDNCGYNTYYTVLDGSECGIPQQRKRVFALSIAKSIDTSLFKFPVPFDNGLRLKDMLDHDVASKYDLTPSNMAASADSNPTFRNYAQSIQACIKTDAQIGDIVCAYNYQSKSDGYIPTITTRPDSLKTGFFIVTDKGEHITDKYRIRKFTPNECWKLMGMTSEDCDKARSMGLSDMTLYKIAGNGLNGIISQFQSVQQRSEKQIK